MLNGFRATKMKMRTTFIFGVFVFIFFGLQYSQAQYVPGGFWARGKRLAVTWASATFKLYNTKGMSSYPNPAVPPAGSINAVAFSPDGNLLGLAHGTSPFVTIYNTFDMSKVANPAVLPANIGRGIAFNPAGTLMAVAHASSPYITIYNTSTWAKLADPAVLPANLSVGVAFSPDGSKMAVVHSFAPYVTIYNTSDWSKIADPAELPASTGYSVAFSPDNSIMAVGHTSSPFLTMYNTSNWTKIANPTTLPANTVFGVAFSPDGTKLATAHSGTPYVTIYNTSNWSKIADPATLPTGSGNGVDWSSDGTRLAVGHGTSPYITVYDTSNWAKINDPGSLPAGNATGVAYSKGSGGASGGGGGGGGPSITFVQQKTVANSGTSTAVTFDAAPTVGNTVVLLIGGRLSSEVLSGVTGCGATFSRMAAGAQSFSNVEIWAGVCTTTASTITASSASTNVRVAVAMEFTNLTAVKDVEATDATAGGWTATMNGVTTVTADTLVIAAGVVDKQATVGTAANNGFTQTAIIDGGSGGSRVSISGAYKIVSATGNYTTTWTFAGTGSPVSTVVGAAIK